MKIVLDIDDTLFGNYPTNGHHPRTVKFLPDALSALAIQITSSSVQLTGLEMVLAGDIALTIA